MRARPTAWAARCALRSSGASGSGVPVHVEVVGAACAPSPSSRTPARACRGPESTTREAMRGVKRDEDRRAGRDLEARGGRARLKPTARPGIRGELRCPDRDMANSAVKGSVALYSEIPRAAQVRDGPGQGAALTGCRLEGALLKPPPEGRLRSSVPLRRRCPAVACDSTMRRASHARRAKVGLRAQTRRQSRVRPGDVRHATANTSQRQMRSSRTCGENPLGARRKKEA